jgi:arylformamidase
MCRAVVSPDREASLRSPVIDITLPLSEDLMAWPGNPQPELVPLKRLADGHDANVSELRVSTHAGTHLDPPRHAISGGATSESIGLDVLVGSVWVADFTYVVDEIHADDLAEHVPSGVTRLLLKTRNSGLWDRPDAPFPSSFVALSTSGASWLVESGVQLVGIDFLSIEAPRHGSRPVHDALLSGAVAVLEGLDLRGVAAGEYRLFCLPLRLLGADGVPARAVLFSRSEDA